MIEAKDLGANYAGFSKNPTVVGPDHRIYSVPGSRRIQVVTYKADVTLGEAREIQEVTNQLVDQLDQTPFLGKVRIASTRLPFDVRASRIQEVGMNPTTKRAFAVSGYEAGLPLEEILNTTFRPDLRGDDISSSESPTERARLYSLRFMISDRRRISGGSPIPSSGLIEDPDLLERVLLQGLTCARERVGEDSPNLNTADMQLRVASNPPHFRFVINNIAPSLTSSKVILAAP